jgi:anti-sigma regulatory factor (Ser/Thr protein kinase)
LESKVDIEPERARHAVRFYDDDVDLAVTAARFLSSGLEHGRAAVVIATPTHVLEFGAALADLGIDIDHTRNDGTYRPLDAAETLSQLMVDGHPDPGCFDHVVGGLVREIEADGRRLIAYGEMVAVLWEAGNVVGALELEELWNRLLDTNRFSLLCAYPASIVGEGLSDVCELHSDVLVGAPAETRDARVTLPPAADSVSASRRFVAESLERWGYAILGNDVVLTVSELASNAVLHARTPFAVSVSERDGMIRVGIEDTNAELPRPERPATDISNGRGLMLVEALAQRWGTEPRDRGKLVWAEFAVTKVPAVP